ncbi:MAG: hypothetical protein IJU64_07095 [Bacilli bacterium]|nr:hypothetical protein [Bacilli bacterium]
MSAWDNEATPGLYTATTDTLTGVTTPREAGGGTLYRVYKISLWLEKTGTGTVEEWTTAVAASNKTISYAFSKTNISHLDTNSKEEIYFYYVAQTTGGAPGIAKASEQPAVGDPVRATLAIDIDTLGTTSETANQIGYLFVRIDGSKQNHAVLDGDDPIDYSVDIAATGTLS